MPSRKLGEGGSASGGQGHQAGDLRELVKNEGKVCLFIVVGVIVVRVVARIGVIIARGCIIHERAPIPIIMHSLPRAVIVDDVGVAGLLVVTECAADLENKGRGGRHHLFVESTLAVTLPPAAR